MKCPNGVFPAESGSMRMMGIGITAARISALPAAAVAMDRPIIVPKADFAIIGRARTKVQILCGKMRPFASAQSVRTADFYL